VVEVEVREHDVKLVNAFEQAMVREQSSCACADIEHQCSVPITYQDAGCLSHARRCAAAASEYDHVHAARLQLVVTDLSIDLVMLGGEFALDEEPIVFGIRAIISASFSSFFGGAVAYRFVDPVCADVPLASPALGRR
jgi:hypothetical protein